MAFNFLSGEAALDLVNTQVIVRGKPVDLLRTPADLAVWWEAMLRHHPSLVVADGDPPRSASVALLAAAKALRAELRRLFEALASGGAIDAADLVTLNDVLATGFRSLAIAVDGAPRAVERSRDPGPRGALLPIARAALTLATERDLSRLHRCGNNRCILLFYDTTKSATRRWCSLGCMNRARSIARYQQRKRDAAG